MFKIYHDSYITSMIYDYNHKFFKVFTFIFFLGSFYFLFFMIEYKKCAVSMCLH